MKNLIDIDKRRLVDAVQRERRSICIDFGGHDVCVFFRSVFFDPDDNPMTETPLSDDLAAIARRVVLSILDEHEPTWSQGAGWYGTLVLRVDDAYVEFTYWERGSDHILRFSIPLAD